MTNFASWTTRVCTTLLLCLAALSVSAQKEQMVKPVNSPAPADITYTVSMPRPFTHLLEVELRLRWDQAPDSTELVMPVWTPGSYLVREYARHVQDFAARDDKGRELSWTKTNKNTWAIRSGGAHVLNVSYRVYANELTVRTNELNDKHAFWNNAALLMYPNGHLELPSTLHVVPIADWKIVTGLPQLEGKSDTFRAENFDHLYDCPFNVGTFKTISFDAKGVRHRVVIDGTGNYDLERLRNGFQRIVNAAIDVIGDVPYKDYTFIVMLRAAGGGGLEHLNSCSIIDQRFKFKDDDGYLDFFELVAHEFFHAWNVKRIRPDALGPFDYNQENYTRLLWVAEGITEYYGKMIPLRAGLTDAKHVLKDMAKSMQDLQDQPGRMQTSLEEASFDAWIKYYRQDANAINNQISYYDKGAIVGALLDLEIRRLSAGKHTLDDVLRHLYSEYFKKGRNYGPEDFQKSAELMAGASLEPFFARYVRGHDELEYAQYLAAAGLQLDIDGPDSSSPAREKPFLGIEVRQDNDRLLIRRVAQGTPGYDQGLSAGDQIVALDEQRVNRDGFMDRIAEKKPGDVILLTVFRDDDLRSFNIKLGGKIQADYRVVPIKDASETQKATYLGWLGTQLAAN